MRWWLNLDWIDFLNNYSVGLLVVVLLFWWIMCLLILRCVIFGRCLYNLGRESWLLFLFCNMEGGVSVKLICLSYFMSGMKSLVYLFIVFILRCGFLLIIWFLGLICCLLICRMLVCVFIYLFGWFLIVYKFVLCVVLWLFFWIVLIYLLVILLRDYCCNLGMRVLLVFI